MAGCSGKVKPESVTDKDAVKEYNKIKNDLDKFFYSPDAKHPVASNVTSLVGELPDVNELQNSPYYNDNQEIGISASVDKMLVQNQDYLKQLGGSLSLSGTMLTSKDGYNYDLGATVSGLTVDLDIAQNNNSLSITSPFMFTQPIYIDLEAFMAMADAESAASMTMSFNQEEIKTALEKWYNEKLNEENQKYLLDMLKDCVSADAVTVSKGTPAELKGDYITFATKTECVTLTITEEVATQFVEKLNDKLSEDAVVKDIVISFLNCFGDDLLKQMTEKTAEELYNELLESFADFEKEITEESEASEDSADASDASAEEEEDIRIVIKRYFAGGHCVKNDIIFENDEEKFFDMTYWDVYANTTAREYGVKLDIEGNNWLNVIGGANKTDATMNATLNIYEDTVDVSEDEAEEKAEKVGTLKLNASRGEAGISVDGSLTAEEDIEASFEYKQSEAVTELKIDVNTADAVCKADYKRTADEVVSNLDMTVEKFELTYNYNCTKTGGTVKASAKEDGEDLLKLDGVITVAENKYAIDADLKLIDGQDSIDVDVLFECTTKTEGSKNEADVKVSIASKELIELEISAKLLYDTDTDKIPEVPSKDGAYVVDDEADAEGLEGIVTDTFKALLDPFGEDTDIPESDEDMEWPDITNYADENMLGTWLYENAGALKFYTFYDDNTGVSGYDYDVIYGLTYGSDAETSTIIIVETQYGGQPTIMKGTYSIEGNMLTILTEDGEELVLTKSDTIRE